MKFKDYVAAINARELAFKEDPEGVTARHQAFIDAQTDERIDHHGMTVQQWIAKYATPTWVCSFCGKGPEEGHYAFLGFSSWFLLCGEME